MRLSRCNSDFRRRGCAVTGSHHIERVGKSPNCSRGFFTPRESEACAIRWPRQNGAVLAACQCGRWRARIDFRHRLDLGARGGSAVTEASCPQRGADAHALDRRCRAALYAQFRARADAPKSRRPCTLRAGMGTAFAARQRRPARHLVAAFRAKLFSEQWQHLPRIKWSFADGARGDTKSRCPA
jgi:hypothetical protein